MVVLAACDTETEGLLRMSGSQNEQMNDRDREMHLTLAAGT